MEVEAAQKLSVAGPYSGLEGMDKLLAEIPSDMVGARIVNIGQPTSAHSVHRDLEGGGLIIDYMPYGSDTIKRAVFAFNDLGMWLEAVCDSKK